MAKKKTEIGGEVPTNGGNTFIGFSEPYIVKVKLKGSSDLLFHRWNCEAVEAKANAARGSKAKKTDDLETFVYRDEKGNLAIPGEYIRQSIIHAAKYKSDPRSPRKSAMDLFKATIVPLTIYCSLGIKAWDYEDKRRVVIQKNAITRTRPAIKTGWECECDLQVNLPEYVSEELLYEVLNMAGRLVGLADFRPTYGRFNIVEFKKT